MTFYRIFRYALYNNAMRTSKGCSVSLSLVPFIWMVILLPVCMYEVMTFTVKCLSNLIFFPVDLPSLSPQLHAALKMVERWTQTFHDKLDSFQGPPPDFISQFPVSQDGFPRGGRALMRYKALMDPQNTPFRWLSTIPVYGVTLRNNVASPYLELLLIQNSSFLGLTLFHLLTRNSVEFSAHGD